MKDPHRYDNLIDHVRPRALKPMPAMNRAAQFSAFAALTGYDDQVKETARLTDREVELAEGEISILDRQLQYLQDHLSEKPVVEITYFVPDAERHKGSKKDGGSYETHEGIIKRIDLYERKVIFYDTAKIQIDRIMDIDGECFVEAEEFFE